MFTKIMIKDLMLYARCHSSLWEHGTTYLSPLNVTNLFVCLKVCSGNLVILSQEAFRSQ